MGDFHFKKQQKIVDFAKTQGFETIAWCPECKSRSVKVLKTNSKTVEGIISRRRFCRECGHQWTTHEISENALLKFIAQTEKIQKDRKKDLAKFNSKKPQKAERKTLRELLSHG